MTFTLVTHTDALHTEQLVAVDVVPDSAVGVANFGMNVSFDTTYLTPAQQGDEWVEWNTAVVGGASSSRFMMSNYDEASGKVYLAFVSSRQNTAANGTVATLYFTVNKDALQLPMDTVVFTPFTDDVMYYDPTNNDAEEDGYVTPSAIVLPETSVPLYHAITVEYYDGDTLVDTAYIPDAGYAVDFPQISLPSRFGYEVTRWEVLTVQDRYMAVQALYGYVVKTVGGTLSDVGYVSDEQWLADDHTAALFNAPSLDKAMLGYENAAQIVANDAPVGKVFSHWEDQYGNVVSYHAVYTFFVPGNMTYTAVYADKAAAKTPAAAMQFVRGGEDAGSITWVCDLENGDTTAYTVVDCGIVYAPTAEAAQNGTVVSANALSVESAQYSVTVGGVDAGESRAAVAFVTYTDNATGNTVTVYSDNVLSLTV